MQNIMYTTKKIQKWFLTQSNPPIWLYKKFEELHTKKKFLYRSAKTEKALKFAHKMFILYPKDERLWVAYLDILFWNNYIYELLEACIEACKIFPESPEFQCRLGRAYLYSGDAEKAAEILRNTSDIPSLCEPIWWRHNYLARAEHFLGNSKEAVNIYKQTVIKWPHSLTAMFRQLVTYEPESSEVLKFADKIIKTVHDESIYATLLFNSAQNFENGHAELCRQRLSTMIDKLSVNPIPITDITKNNSSMVFEQIILFDQNINDRDLRKKLATLYMQCNADITSYSAPSLEIKKKARLRVGFSRMSRFNAIDFSLAIYNIFNSFDTSKFELIFFAEKNIHEEGNYDKICSIFSKVIVYDVSNWKEYKRLVLQEKLDIYVAENVVSPPLTMAFFSRFAPVQINGWDRCDSFGAPHTDYFLVFGEKNKCVEWSSYIEEKYAVLSKNYAAPKPKRAEPAQIDYATLNLPKGSFFFYSQSLARLLPQEDHIIATLLRNNPTYYFFALNFNFNFSLIWYRWKKIMPDCMDRIKFIHHPQPLPIFLGLVSEASVILSSISSSHGALTSSTMFAQCVPMVAGYGCHWGSYITRYQYEQMGVKGLIASSHEEYIAIAQRLIDDPDWKKQKSNEIKENFHKTYNPHIASQEMQDFFLQAYERARLGLKPEHWEHGNFIDYEKYPSF